MQITQEIRDTFGSARAPNRAEAADAEAGMAEKAAEFREKGGEIYLSEDGTVREPID